MPVDEQLILYSLANTFDTNLKVPVSAGTKAYVKAHAKAFKKLTDTQKACIDVYAGKMASSLTAYLKKISLFDIPLPADKDPAIEHDFKLTWDKSKTTLVSLSAVSIQVNNIIPEKLMKICKYKKNTKISQSYLEEYEKINAKALAKMKKKEKYSEVTADFKLKYITTPVAALLQQTLTKKRKCSQILFDYLFAEQDRIVFVLSTGGYTMLDFGKDVAPADSFRLKHKDPNEIIITFNNGAVFHLDLRINSTDIRTRLSLKFHTKYQNMAETFGVCAVKC